MKKIFLNYTFFFTLFAVLFAAQGVRAEKVFTSKFLRSLAKKAKIFSPQKNGAEVLLLGSGSESTAYLMKLNHRFANREGYVAVKLANESVLEENNLRTMQYLFSMRLEGQRQLQMSGWKYAAIDEMVDISSKDIPLIQRYVEGPTVSSFISNYGLYGFERENIVKFVDGLQSITHSMNYDLRKKLRKLGVDAQAIQLGNLDLNFTNLIIPSKKIEYLRISREQLNPMRDVVAIDW